MKNSQISAKITLNLTKKYLREKLKQAIAAQCPITCKKKLYYTISMAVHRNEKKNVSIILSGIINELTQEEKN